MVHGLHARDRAREIRDRDLNHLQFCGCMNSYSCREDFASIFKGTLEALLWVCKYILASMKLIEHDTTTDRMRAWHAETLEQYFLSGILWS